MRFLKLDTMKTASKETKLKIVFTGGGTAGHALPNFLLIKELIKRHGTENLDIIYIGSCDGIEYELFNKEFSDVISSHFKYKPIRCDKLRRYMTYKHLFVPFNLIAGFYTAFNILRKFKPDLVFSKGGFVSVPVILGAKLLGLKTIVHESDYSIGLANKIACKFASHIFVSFDDTLKNNPKYVKKMSLLNPLIEFSHIANGDNSYEHEEEKIYTVRRNILIMGGSLGARVINDLIYKIYDKLTNSFNLVHICGKGNSLESFKEYNGKDANYELLEYVDHDQMLSLIENADMIISRAGVNSAFEIAHAQKPVLFIPLSKKRSRGDQIENAHYFKKYNICEVLQEEDLSEDTLFNAVQEMIVHLEKYQNAYKSFKVSSGIEECCNFIEDFI